MRALICKYRPDILLEVLADTAEHLNELDFLRDGSYEFHILTPAGPVRKDRFEAGSSRDYGFVPGTSRDYALTPLRELTRSRITAQLPGSTA